MECASCGHANALSRKFCTQCGTRLAVVCPACGQPAEPGDSFCGECGAAMDPTAPAAAAAPPPASAPPHTAVAPPATESTQPSPRAAGHTAERGERRQATIVFSDLSGYTAMNERLDPEEVEGVMSRIKAEAVQIVESHGGIVNQFVGDEVMALFGIPTAHEDDPRRAVQAALELHQAARELSPAVEERIGRPLRMHTGIHTGLIVTSLRDDRNGRYGVTGDTVNTGARLKALAADDEILASQDTQKLIAPFFATEALAPVEMKGKARPVQLFRVGAPSQVQSRLDAAQRRGFTPFTGRESERAALEAAQKKAASGQGQLVTVVAEAGLGKSRLLHEFRQGLDAGRVTVLEGQCLAQGSNTPYLPLLDTLRGGLNLGAGADPREQVKTALATIRGIDRALEANLPVYLHLLSLSDADYPLPATLQGEELRRAIQLALSALITLSAAHKPVVLLLEDWQWADEASTSALKYLAGVMARTPLLIVVTYRTEYAADWGAPSHLTQVPLHPLDEAQSEVIVKSSLEADVLPGGLAELIYERTAGNPFFIEEICRALLEQGSVEVREVRQAVLTQSLEDLALPETVHAVIRSRLDRLEPDLREVLGLASVVGREFSGRVLERLHSDAALLARCLEQLKALELIQQVRLLPDAGYVFKQAATQEVAYETLLLQRRRTLHLQAAETMEELYGDRLSEFSESLARHYRHGEAWGKAARYFLAATQSAKAHYAYQNALRLCRRALEASEKEETLVAERGDILVLLGDLRSLLGELEPANAHYEEGLALAGDPERRRWIENKLHRRHETEREGAKLVYYEHGSGEQTLLVLRPMTYGIEHFQPVVEQLCQEFRIITMDPRGSGDSDPIQRPYQLSQHLEDVKAIIEASGAAPITCVGVSRAGTLMIMLAAAYPQLLEKMVLVAPAPPVPEYEGYVSASERFPDVEEAVREKDLKRAVRLFAPTVMSEPGTGEMLQQVTEWLLSVPEETTYSFFLDRDDDANVYKHFREIGVPTLVMHGTEDIRVPYQQGRYIATQIPGAKMYSFEGRGHLPMTTATGEFCEVLRQFVRTGEVPGGEGR